MQCEFLWSEHTMRRFTNPYHARCKPPSVRVSKHDVNRRASFSDSTSPKLRLGNLFSIDIAENKAVDLEVYETVLSPHLACTGPLKIILHGLNDRPLVVPLALFLAEFWYVIVIYPSLVSPRSPYEMILSALAMPL